MKCIFKKPTGDKCGLETLEKSKYCYLHDPESVSLYIISDYEKYKRGQAVLGVPKDKGMNLIKNGIALILDRRLYSSIFGKDNNKK